MQLSVDKEGVRVIVSGAMVPASTSKFDAQSGCDTLDEFISSEEGSGGLSEITGGGGGGAAVSTRGVSRVDNCRDASASPVDEEGEGRGGRSARASLLFKPLLRPAFSCFEAFEIKEMSLSASPWTLEGVGEGGRGSIEGSIAPASDGERPFV